MLVVKDKGGIRFRRCACNILAVNFYTARRNDAVFLFISFFRKKKKATTDIQSRTELTTDAPPTLLRYDGTVLES